MSDVVSLELVLDPDSDAAIRREWAALVDADLPSQANHTGASNQPHITLLVRSELPELDAADLDAHLPLALTLGAPLLFGIGRSRVIARSVIPSSDLLALHARVHDLAGPGADGGHTIPGSWTPHVTLGRRIPLDRIPDALAALAGEGGGEVAAHATAIRRWDARTKTVSSVAGRGTLDGC